MTSNVTQIRQQIANEFMAAQRGTSKQQFSTTRIEEQNTQTVPVLPCCTFHDYLQRYKLLWHDVARVARVPVIVVWSIDHGLMVSPDNARRVRSALHIVTGKPFTGLIAVMK